MWRAFQLLSSSMGLVLNFLSCRTAWWCTSIPLGSTTLRKDSIISSSSKYLSGSPRSPASYWLSPPATPNSLPVTTNSTGNRMRSRMRRRWLHSAHRLSNVLNCPTLGLFRHMKLETRRYKWLSSCLTVRVRRWSGRWLLHHWNNNIAFMNESYKRYWEPSYLTAIGLSLATGALATTITYPLEYVKRIIQFRAEGVGIRGTNGIVVG